MAADAAKFAKKLAFGGAWWTALKTSLFFYAVWSIIATYVVGKTMGPPEFFQWWWELFLKVARWVYGLFADRPATGGPTTTVAP